MSLKALQRRAREARIWLGQRCLPLWSEAGNLRPEGFIDRLQLNHRPFDAPIAANPVGQYGLSSLFELAEFVGFDTVLAADLIAMATPLFKDEAVHEMAEAEFESHSMVSASLALVDAFSDVQSLSEATARESAAMTTCRAFDHLIDNFLTPEGGWIAGYTEDGLPTRNDIPAELALPLGIALKPLVSWHEA